jgi:hypothetical protein
MTIELSARVTYTAAKARHRWRRRQGHAPTVVFAMAKTGSSSIAAGLRAAGFDAVHQVHDLDPAFLDREEAEYRWSGRPWRIWDAQQLLRQPPTVSHPWRVISMVRDPIAQAISAFFQPGVRRGYLHAGATVEGLRERFGDRLDRLPLHWFETHLQPALGIDVYASEFDPGQGYQIIEMPTVRLLLLRCEDLDAGATGLAQLLGWPRPVPIPRLNVGAEKQHADLYRAFRQAVLPTAAQLDHAYGSRLVRHFYSGEEIDRFRALWSGDPPAAR